MLDSIRKSLYVVVCLVTGAMALRATGENHRSWTIQRFSDDTSALSKFASDTKAATGTDVVVLDDEKTYVLDADGSATITSYLVYEVRTQKGADGWDGDFGIDIVAVESEYAGGDQAHCGANQPVWSDSDYGGPGYGGSDG